MIKKRIVPTLTYKNGGLVKSSQFNHYRMLGDPIQAIKVYNLRDVDEILFVDISENVKKPNFKLIENILQYAFMPITVGGGISTVEDVSNLLLVGADKICISSKAFENLTFVKQLVDQFGSQAIVISIDYCIENNMIYLVFNPGMKKIQVDLIKYIADLSHIGISEIVLTSVKQDGSMCGYDIEFVKKIEHITQSGIIINGGAGTYEHMLEAFIKSNVVGVAAASMFHFTEQTPRGAANFLKKNNINVRV